MGQFWTRDDWNDIIQRINNLSQNPPEGCDSLDPLDEVPENHKWSVGDIVAIRDRLLEICEDNVFEVELFSPTGTAKWTQSIIDEINAAIEAGWCGCEGGVWEGPYTISLPPEHTYTQGNIEVFPNFPVAGCTTRIYHWTDLYSWWPCAPCPSVGPPNITGRTATLTVVGTKTAIYGGATTSASFTASGPVENNGSVGWLASAGGDYFKETQTWADHPEWGEFVVYSNGYTFNFTLSDLYVDRP
jgi:hypothetical protein